MPTDLRKLDAAGRDPVDVAVEWVEVALQGRPWTVRDNYPDADYRCWVERGTTKGGDLERFIETPLTALEGAIIERLLAVARGENGGAE